MSHPPHLSAFKLHNNEPIPAATDCLQALIRAAHRNRNAAQTTVGTPKQRPGNDAHAKGQRTFTVTPHKTTFEKLKQRPHNAANAAFELAPIVIAASKASSRHRRIKGINRHRRTQKNQSSKPLPYHPLATLSIASSRI